MRSTFDPRFWLPVLGLVVPLGGGCKKSDEGKEAAREAPAPAADAQPGAPADAESPAAGEGEVAAKDADKPATLDNAGFRTPESVLHDPEQDVYFVSNIDGSPFDEDDNGFIARVNAETQDVETKWIDGSKEEVTLNAPKGLAISGDLLYVADINTVRKFDRKTGESKGQIDLEGTTFVNGLVTGPDGVLYASDTGLKAGDEGFAPSGTDAVFKINLADDSVEKIAEGESLGGPNGLAVDDKGVWAATFRSNEIYRLEKGAKADVQTLEKGSLDGLVRLSDGTFLTASWEGKAVYQGQVGGPFKAVIENLESPAGIGFDAKRNLVLVPLFELNKVQLAPLPAPGA